MGESILVWQTTIFCDYFIEPASTPPFLGDIMNSFDLIGSFVTFVGTVIAIFLFGIMMRAMWFFFLCGWEGLEYVFK